MKPYTDLYQSKKLSDILPVESADMTWVEGEWGEPIVGKIIKSIDENYTFIPCWSLSALLEVIGVECRMEKTPLDQSGEFTYSMVDDYNSIRTFECDNPVDACFEMILNLNEQNLL